MKAAYIFLLIILASWNVRSQNIFESESNTEKYSLFTLSVLPVTPQLTFPEDEAEDVSVLPELTWEDANAESYRIQIAAYNGTGTTVIIDTETDTNFYKPKDTLDFETLHFWQVRSIVGVEESEWSETWSFTTYSKLGTPIQLFPPDNAQDVELNVDLVWTSVEGAEAYWVVCDYYFKGELREAFVNGTKDTVVSLHKLFDNQHYSWKVHAFRDGQSGEESPVFSFRTKKVVSVDDIGNDDISIYPSPADEFINISAGGNEINSVSIISIEGISVQEHNNLNTKDIRLDLTALSTGSYILRIGSGSKFTNKLITKI